MLRSMTGFGQADRSAEGMKFQVDLKSVNHRYCEILIRMPREWLSYEDRIKRAIQQAVKRGRVDVFITVEREPGSVSDIAVDWTLADSYYQASEELKKRYHMSDSLSLRELVAIPGLVTIAENSERPSDVMGNELIECVQQALSGLTAMREQEGANLYADMKERLLFLESLLSGMSDMAPEAIAEYRDKLRARVEDLLQDTSLFDDQRFAMEIALMADRYNIDEELTRLKSHISQFSSLIKANEPIGRKLDFLIQEMNREINTVGSKANHVPLVNIVVAMKAELEKIREQIQNIE